MLRYLLGRIWRITVEQWNSEYCTQEHQLETYMFLTPEEDYIARGVTSETRSNGHLDKGFEFLGNMLGEVQFKFDITFLLFKWQNYIPVLKAGPAASHLYQNEMERCFNYLAGQKLQFFRC